MRFRCRLRQEIILDIHFVVNCLLQFSSGWATSTILGINGLNSADVPLSNKKTNKFWLSCRRWRPQYCNGWCSRLPGLFFRKPSNGCTWIFIGCQFSRELNSNSRLLASRLDYCNSVLYGVSETNIAKLQWMQNILARVVCKSPYNTNVTERHWLPVGLQHRITYKVVDPEIDRFSRSSRSIRARVESRRPIQAESVESIAKQWSHVSR